MKLFLLFVSFLVFTNASTFLPTTQRFRRDVTELGNQYLGPGPVNFHLLRESATETFTNPQLSQDSAVFPKVSYQNKTGSDLSIRQRHNVSHLELAYLPPAAPAPKKHSTSFNPTLPPVEVPEINELLITSHSNEYLPPVDELNEAKIEIKTPPPFKEYPPAVEELNEKEVKTEPSQPFKEYLASVPEIKESEIVTEQTKQYFEDTHDYLSSFKFGETFLEVPFETSQKTTENIEIGTNPLGQPTLNESSAEVVEAQTEGSHDTVVLEADGYHYKIPENLPNLFPSINLATEYLPPLEEGVVEAEGPANGETATLEEDGYHYRTIKRLF